jgi:hypothetical protein
MELRAARPRSRVSLRAAQFGGGSSLLTELASRLEKNRVKLEGVEEEGSDSGSDSDSDFD